MDKLSDYLQIIEQAIETRKPIEIIYQSGIVAKVNPISYKKDYVEKELIDGYNLLCENIENKEEINLPITGVKIAKINFL